MNRAARYLSRRLSKPLSIKWLSARKIPCFLPFYHVVSDDELPHIKNYPYRNISEFERELDFFLTHFQPITAEELLKGECTGKKFHLSFDDGLRECAEIVAPILFRKGVPATFFINSAFIDNKDLFHRYKASLILEHLNKQPVVEAEKLLTSENLNREKILQAKIGQTAVLDKVADIIGVDFDDFLKQQQPYMTTSQIEDLARQKFSVGAHSHSHPEFYHLTAQEQIAEINRSMMIIDKIVDPKIRLFAFPYTDDGVKKEVLQTIHEKGICDLSFGTAGVKYDNVKNHYQRYPVEQRGNFILNLKEELLYFELRKMLGKAKVDHK